MRKTIHMAAQQMRVGIIKRTSLTSEHFKFFLQNETGQLLNCSDAKLTPVERVYCLNKNTCCILLHCFDRIPLEKSTD